MKSFRALNFKEKLEYIGILAIYPLILLYGSLGKSVKFLNSRKKQITASILIVCLMLTMIPLSAITVSAATDGTIKTESVELKYVSGSGKTRVYYDFVETTAFSSGTSYAFLENSYKKDDAITKFGSGAVLEATSKSNGSEAYIKEKYGADAKVAVYVNVIQKGAGFDGCKAGGLYKVPNTSGPVEYRYFCCYGGAKNCGPLYAYTYSSEDITAKDMSCTLNNLDNLDSLDSSDYTVKISYGTGTNNFITLAPSNYTVSKTSTEGRILIKTADDNGNEIKATFETPLKLSYIANDTEDYKATGMPKFQAAWKGNDIIVNTSAPKRTGYKFSGYSDGLSTLNPGYTLTLNENTVYTAKWTDTAAPSVTSKAVTLMTRATEKEIKNAVKEALTIKDNEPVSECVITYPNFDAAISKKSGTKTVKVTVTDKAGNSVTVNVSITFNASPLEIKNVKFTESSNKLEATLYEAGPDIITETGFVWGIMQNPSITLNNGSAKTSAVVTEPDGIISVVANNLQKGVNYYARAYAKAGGSTYYSPQINFGIDAPDYGMFTISGPGSVSSSGTVKFTIKRSGSEGKQTVYYRTLNGSAIGGTHFTHAAGELVFEAGETSKTVSVSVKTANTKYSSYIATAYTNINREFFMEIYNVVGGASLGDSTKAKCTMTSGSSYNVPESVYTVHTWDKSEEQRITADEGFEKVTTIDTTTTDASKYQEYLSALGLKFNHSLQFSVKEVDKGYQSIQITKGQNVDNSSVDANGSKLVMSNKNGNVQFAAMFEHGGTKKETNWGLYLAPKLWYCKSVNDWLHFTFKIMSRVRWRFPTGNTT